MRFIYIDSQGREVKIPSVDALRLRIELGAIKDQTQFHDENTGRWAPAAEHDIYRTLKRELDALESGFVAPPPPAPGDPVSEGESQTAPDAAERAAGGLDAAAGAEALEDADAVADPGELDPMPTEAPADPDPAVQADEEVDPLAMDLGLAAQASREPAAEGGAEPEEDDDEFGAGPLWDDEPDVGSDEASGPDRAGVATSAGGEAGEDVPPGDDDASADEVHGAGDETRETFIASAEEELMQSVGGDGSHTVAEDAGLDLEPSLSESFDTDVGPIEPPPPGGDDQGWARPEDEAAAQGSAPSWSAGTESQVSASPAPESVPTSPPAAGESAPAPRPRPRSAPPPRKLTRAGTPGARSVVGLVVAAAVVAGLAFFGWRYLTPMLGGGGPDEPEVTLPPLDEALMPRMRQLAGRAAAGMSQTFLALPEREVISDEPSPDWLAGIYLANASDFPNVPDYWNAVRDWTDAAQASEMPAFRDAFRTEVESADLPASSAEAVRNRGLAGFQAAGPERRVVYAQLRAVAERALSLHQFLLANEDLIDYEPAATGVSRDPVLEAVPASEALGDDMWAQVESITNALDALGYLDQIDTRRLLGAFLEKLEASAVR